MAFPIGVIADCLRQPFAQSLKTCASLGIAGVQLYAVSGELAPENLSAAARREKQDIIQSYGLKVSALCGDLGGHGFTRKSENPAKIERSKRIIDLALDLGTNIVTTHIGVIPADQNSETYAVLYDACEELASYAHSVGACFAVETGPEPAERLYAFLSSLSTRGVGVNLDPANFVMVTDEDPARAVGILKDYIVHTHAKDGIMRKKTDPQIIYDFFAEGGIGDLRLEDYFLETPLGEGKVDFGAYLQALESAGYQGFLTIERETGADPLADVKRAVDYLRQMMD